MDNCTVYFEDNGQDFLEFDIVNNIVVGCRPSQSWAWLGMKVGSIVGGHLEVVNGGVLTTLNHKVKYTKPFVIGGPEKRTDGAYPVDANQPVFNVISGTLANFGQQLYLVNDAHRRLTTDPLHKEICQLSAKCADLLGQVRNYKVALGKISEFIENVWPYVTEDANHLGPTLSTQRENIKAIIAELENSNEEKN